MKFIRFLLIIIIIACFPCCKSSKCTVELQEQDSVEVHGLESYVVRIIDSVVVETVIKDSTVVWVENGNTTTERFRDTSRNAKKTSIQHDTVTVTKEKIVYKYIRYTVREKPPEEKKVNSLIWAFIAAGVLMIVLFALPAVINKHNSIHKSINNRDVPNG